MPPPPVLTEDPRASKPRVLLGKVVTMTGGVIADGAVYCRDGEIQVVQSAREAAPPGFERAARLDTRGVIYPGMIDLHNHLEYNVQPLWRPTRIFGDRYEWRDDLRYKAEVQKVAKVMQPVSAAIIRYVEVKLLVGGVTSAQGMNVKKRGHYRGMVRNFESTGDAAYPEIEHELNDWDRLDLDPAELARKQEQMRIGAQSGKRFFHHLAEGKNERAHEAYRDLLDKDVFGKNYVGIHCAGLKSDDYAVYAGKDAKAVWSPLSNLLLYGRTVEVKEFLASGVTWGLGSDWSPSGTKNLLGEMKVAWLAAKDAGVNLDYRTLAEAVTSRAADIVGWGKKLGRIEPGCGADLLVLAPRFPDPYENLFRAVESDVLLVMIEGVPRFGDVALMRQAGLPDELEACTVAKRARLFYGRHPAALDAVNQLSLAEATATLTKAMADLEAIERHEKALGFLPDPDRIELELEMDEDPPAVEKLAAALVEEPPMPKSMDLDPLTVVDDPKYFARLEQAPAAPDYLRKLRDFYP